MRETSPPRPYTAEWRVRRRIWNARLIRSEGTVDGDQAVGDAVDVVHLLHVGAALGADLAPEGRLLDERAKRVGEGLLRRGNDRDAHPEALGALLDDVLLEVGDDGLAERHRFECEDAVPAGVQLVDDD